MDKDTLVFDSLFVTIRNRQKIVFDDEVKGLTSVNERGLFDILPQHESFICMIKDKLVLHKKDGQHEDIQIVKGILRGYKNNVQIYIV